MSDVNETVETVDEETDEEIPGLDATPMDFYSSIMGGGSDLWTTLPRGELEIFAEGFRNFVAAVSTLASNFNKQVWDGWESGTVPTDVKGTREQRSATADKPGRKPAVKTAAQRLLRK